MKRVLRGSGILGGCLHNLLVIFSLVVILIITQGENFLSIQALYLELG